MIRQAHPGDAPKIGRLIILAMEDMAAQFVGHSDPYQAVPLFERFAGLTANQYSYENILVYEDEDGVCGMISAYNGADLELLRSPFLAYVAANFGFTQIPENETQEGEYYIDCVSVAEDKQGKGIGKELINALVEYAANINQPAVGLLVSKNNPKAKKLYERLGFKVVKEREFMGDYCFHLQHIK